jgi:diaminohydroxyphosphoribosylaminopyrimidine deaminase/5-amino-6-(5-phosphoribosylamino)uracil reductase
MPLRTTSVYRFSVVDFPCMPHPVDEQPLQRALELARLGIGLAGPNPCVGAVIADAQGNVAGTGTYTYDGVKHAEILALESAGARSRDGTLYINLEPHSHQGRTPPCTDALIAAGIRRVVASMPDPNPKVSGRGFDKLRAAGVKVEVGALEAEARKLNEAFARYIRHGVPLVTLKSAMTLDGKIAPPPGEVAAHAEGVPPGGGFSGNWITGEPARAHVHELRHQHDAILAGVGTILADNPLLTDRSGRLRRRALLRVILDSHLRLPLESRLVQSAASDQTNNDRTYNDQTTNDRTYNDRTYNDRTYNDRKNNGRGNDVVVFCTSTDSVKKSRLEQRGIRVEVLPDSSSDHRPDISAVLHRLGQLEIASLMIEGGSTVNGSALAADVVDKVFLYYAPQIFASKNAVPFAAGAAFADTSQTLQVKNLQLHRFGQDFAVEGYLRDPYGE